MSYRADLEQYYRAAGHARTLPALDQEHPFVPDSIVYAGRAG